MNYKEGCSSCPLRELNSFVPFEGDFRSPVWFIGEAPGQTEVKLRRPFVGRSGKLFREIMNSYLPEGWEKKVLIGNVVLCRPPGNATPDSKIISICTEQFLLPLMQTYKPRLIVTMGQVSRQLFLKRADIYYIPVIKRDKIIYHIHHPAYITRNPQFRERYAEKIGTLCKLIKILLKEKDV